MNVNYLIKKYKRLIRFCIVGVINTAVDFIIFIFLNKFIGVYYLFSQIAGYIGGIINSFILNKTWTFNNKNITKKTPQELAQFILINIVSLSISLIGMRIFVNSLYLSVIIAKVMVTFLAQVINYAGYKFLVFR